MHSRMQPISFRNVEEFLDFLPEDELQITEFLRRIVQECLPHATEHLAYNVPYYKGKKNICFIWPASVIWGSKKTYEGVRFGFTQGHLLEDAIAYLDRGDRKQVCWRDFTDVNAIDVDLLRSYIFQAAELDSGSTGTTIPERNRRAKGR